MVIALVTLVDLLLLFVGVEITLLLVVGVGRLLTLLGLARPGCVGVGEGRYQARNIAEGDVLLDRFAVAVPHRQAIADGPTAIVDDRLLPRQLVAVLDIALDLAGRDHVLERALVVAGLRLEQGAREQLAALPCRVALAPVLQCARLVDAPLPQQLVGALRQGIARPEFLELVFRSRTLLDGLVEALPRIGIDLVERGAIVEDALSLGTPQEVQNDPKVIEAYIGTTDEKQEVLA